MIYTKKIKTMLVYTALLLLFFTCENASDDSSSTNTNTTTDISTLKLEYDTSTAIVIGTAKSFTATTTIPDSATVTYTIKLQSDGSAPTGITMNGSTIEVANSVAEGTYALTVTATPSGTGFSGTKTANVSITINSLDISTLTLSYDTTTAIVAGTSTSFDATTNIPDSAATYTIERKTGGAAPTGISMTGSTIEVASSVAVGAYELSITATASSTGYAGSKTTDTTITITTIDISTLTLSYDTSTAIAAGTSQTFTATTTIPDSAATYTIGLQAGGPAPTGITMTGSTIEVANSVAVGAHELSITATASSTNYSGSITTNTTITITTIDISTLTLSYDTSTAITAGTAQTFVATTNIPDSAATYAIALQAGGAAPTGITMTGSSIEVANAVAEGTYALTVTATPSDAGFSGIKTANVSITIRSIDISTLTLSYDTSTAIVAGTAQTFTATTTIPDSAATYAIALQAGGAAPTGITMTGSSIEVASSVAVGVHELSITATASSTSYSSSITVDTTITITAIDISTLTLSYDTSTAIAAGTAQTFTATTTIPDSAATYTIGLQAGGPAPTGITMTGSTIEVANSVAVGVHELSITATASSTSYSGSIITTTTITIFALDISGFQLTYLDEGFTIPSTQDALTFSPNVNDIPDGAATYSFQVAGAPAGYNADNITINDATGAVQFGNTKANQVSTAEATYTFTITASPANSNFTGSVVSTFDATAYHTNNANVLDVRFIDFNYPNNLQISHATGGTIEPSAYDVPKHAIDQNQMTVQLMSGITVLDPSDGISIDLITGIITIAPNLPTLTKRMYNSVYHVRMAAVPGTIFTSQKTTYLVFEIVD